MKLKNLNGWAYFTSSFLILLIGGFFAREGLTQPHEFASAARITDGVEIIDPHFFAQAASDIAVHGWVTEANNWVLHLWPPGFVLLEAGILESVRRPHD